MSIELKAIQVRLPAEAYEALKMLADINEQDLGEAARLILTRALLGEVHAAKVMAARFARATESGSARKADSK